MLVKIQKFDNPRGWQDTKGNGNSDSLLVGVNRYNHSGKHLAIFIEITNAYLFDSAVPILGVYPTDIFTWAKS